MIVELFFYVVKYLLVALFWVLPEASSFPLITDSINFVLGYLPAINTFFPISTLFLVSFVILNIEFSYATFRLINFVYNKFRGSGG